LLEVSEGLPRYYTAGDLTIELAKTKIKREGIRLLRIYYESPVVQYFDYSNGNEDILISPFLFEVMDRHKLKDLPLCQNEEEKKLIREKWGQLRKMVK